MSEIFKRAVCGLLKESDMYCLKKNLRRQVMKVFFKRAVTTLLTAAMFSCSMPSGDITSELTQEGTRGGSYFRAPSVNPPHGLPVNEVPQFVSFGFDDNGNTEGMQTILDVFSNKVNPGRGNDATYDSTPASVTFFNASLFAEDVYTGDAVKALWKKAYNAGHEMANHTQNHSKGAGFSTVQWEKEIDNCTATVTAAVGGTVSVTGFKAPYLSYNDNLYSVLKGKNMYDNSIEEGFEADQDGTNFYWPYTLDNGSPGNAVTAEWGVTPLLAPAQGVWAMPVYTVVVPPELRDDMSVRQSWFDVNSGKITGDEYTLWVTFSMTKAEYLATLKHTLDLRLTGNRAPMILGSNANMYANSYISAKGSTAAERKAALSEFVDYALAQDAVRVVSVEKALKWVKTPGQVQPLTHTVTPFAGPNGTISPSAPVTVNDGESVVFTLNPDLHYGVDRVTVNGVVVTVVNNQVVIPVVDTDLTVNVSFVMDFSDYWYVDVTSTEGGSAYVEGVMPVTTGGDVTIVAVPDAGYEATMISVDGRNYPFDGTNVFPLNNITSDLSVKVFFTAKPVAKLKAEYKLTQDWGTGFGASVVITNVSDSAVNSWKAVLTFKGDETVTGWGAEIVQTGRVVTISNLSWNGTINPGASVNIGLNGQYMNGMPSDVFLTVE